MAQNFPSNPTLNTPYTINNESWAYDGSGWVRVVTASGTGILPSVSGNSGKYLTTDGSTISWGTVTTSSVTISDTAPASPTSGNIWFDSTKLNTYVYYNDGDSSQWVNATSVSVGTILPTQTGNTGKFLTTDGSTVSWATFTGYAGSAGYSGSTGYTGSASTAAGYTGSAGVGYTGSAAVGGGTPASVSSQANTATDFFAIPIGTTVQRPASPANGYMRFNTTTGFGEIYNATSSQWLSFGTAPTLNVEYLLVGGGAGATGGTNGVNFGAGGAGGVLRTATVSFSVNTLYTVTVGGGGTGVATGTPGPGTTSTLGSFTATGGNGAASNSTTGGSNADYAGGSPSGSFGAGGGAGAGGAGVANNGGGPGAASSISGTLTYYGGGGGGRDGSGNGTGGSGGGANSATSANANTGGGAGGTSSGGSFTNGGSGIIIIKYLATYTATFSGGLTASTPGAVNGYKISTVTAGTGTVTFS
jgi:hypothetical protein